MICCKGFFLKVYEEKSKQLSYPDLFSVINIQFSNSIKAYQKLFITSCLDPFIQLAYI